MTKILHIADVHLGYQQYGLKDRELDGYKAFEAVVFWAIDNEVEIILVAGDFFHSVNIRARAWGNVIRLLGIVKEAGIKVIMVEGNHDRPLFSADQTWTETLQAQQLAQVLGTNGQPEWVDCLGVRIVGLPYLGHHTAAALDRIYTAMEKEKSPQPTILLCHIGISEAIGGLIPGMYRKELEEKLHKDIVYVATGHFHRPWSGGIIHCPGTINPCKIDEPYGGLSVFDIDKAGRYKSLYVPIEGNHGVRPIFQDRAGNLDEVIVLSGRWAGAVVQLKYGGDETQDVIRDVLLEQPLKLIIDYQSAKSLAQPIHQVGGNRKKLEAALLKNALGDESQTAIQLIQYVSDEQSKSVIANFIKESVGISCK